MGRSIAILVLIVGLSVALSPADARASTIREVLLEHGFDGALDGMAKPLNLDLDAPGATAEADRRNPGELVISTKYGVRLRIDRSSKRCVGYLREHVVVDGERIASVSGPIDESKARGMALNFLASANIEYAPESVSLSYSNPSRSDRGNLAFAHYTVRAQRRYQGYLAQSGVTVVVDAQGGRIRMFRDLPLVPPVSIVENVDEAEALRIVLAEMASRKVSIVGSPTMSLGLVYPNNIWKIASYDDYARESTMKLCWVARVRLSKNPGGAPMILYVDAANGTIVGGMY